MPCLANRCIQGRKSCPAPERCLLVTTNGGEHVDTDAGLCLPITMHERPSMLANGWFWVSALVGALLWSAVALLR